MDAVAPIPERDEPALARLHRYPTEPRQLRPEIPAATEAVVMQAMSRSPNDRFASAAELNVALSALAIGEQIALDHRASRA